MAKQIHMGSRQSSEFDQMLESEISKKIGGQAQGQDTLGQAKAKLALRKATLMPAQLAFLTDPAERKAAICTRQSGKTYVNRHMALEAVLANEWKDRASQQPVIQYIALTRAKALDQFWTPFKEICKLVGYDAHWDDHQLRAQFPNGVLVRAGGAEDREEIEKYRGDTYPLVIIDEAASFGPRIEELVLSALSAAMMKYQGTIAMTGTPGQAQVGLFFEIWAGQKPEWSAHRWSYMTNIHLPEKVRSEEWIIANEGPIDSPRIQREFFGNWVSDASSLVYQYDSGKCSWDGILPKGHDWRYLMGVDFGYRDDTAFVVGAYTRTHPGLFIVHAESHPHMLPGQIEKKLLDIRTKFPMNMVVADFSGATTKGTVIEWNRRHGLGIKAAEKQQKFTYVEHMNSDFYLGRIKVAPGLDKLTKEWKTLVYAEEDSKKLSARHDDKPKEHSGFANHLADASLYMFRESMHFRSKRPEPEPIWGTEEYLHKEQRDAKLKAMKAAGKKGFSYDQLFTKPR